MNCLTSSELSNRSKAVIETILALLILLNLCWLIYGTRHAAPPRLHLDHHLRLTVPAKVTPITESSPGDGFSPREEYAK